MAASTSTRAEETNPGIDPVEWELRVQLAAAFRINAHLGWEDSMNTHTTVRLPGPEHHFLINPFGVRFDEVTASGLVKIDVDGNRAEPGDDIVNEAGFVIHSAIHMAREDAKAIVHTHTTAGMAVAALEHGLLPIGIFAIGFHDRVSYHDFEGASGGHNISERERLAARLGPRNNALILRNHGLLTVGETVAEAFIWMYRLERACETQVATYGSGGGYTLPSERARARTVRGTDDFMTAYGAHRPGELEFAAWMRLMDRLDPSYRN